jgi:hypothetical protein
LGINRRRRLDRLESRQGGCSECGWGTSDLEYEVVWDDGWSEVPEERERKRHEDAQRKLRTIDAEK